MAVHTYLEEALENVIYESLGDWCVPNIQAYSLEKTMFSYQITALKNAIKTLYIYYKDNEIHKLALYDMCLSEGLKNHSFDIQENNNGEVNPKFERLSKRYPIVNYNGANIISEKEFFNRMCFWMATASGKTLVLIKMIEIIDYLQSKNLIPKKDIMILLPTDKIQAQFENEVESYNIGKDRPIRLISLKKYEDEKNNFVYDLENKIQVFVYRSDLLSGAETAKRIDTFTYDNSGNWYIFMDEAHKGDKEDSLRQDYVTILSRNGFLFNFSATFTDAIDFATTCFNFNLEKFIEAKYGKNVYLSNSKYNFKRGHNDLDAREKQLQVFKSLITFTLVKKAKKTGFYHNPLMVTLVNEVNTKDSDTDMFFEELGKIANNKFDQELFDTAKIELYDEFKINRQFQFGKESLYLDDNKIKNNLDNMTMQDILKYVYNADSYGVIEVVEGEKGKEFALKLASSEKPFALFRIGDASQYIKEKLVNNYLIINSYEEKHYFDSLNDSSGSNFNILIGSRMFYEGWDSNRPNVMNFINIGKGDAKKFVLQSLGRGVRIEPTPNNRQRLPANNSNKEQVLETLFIFATNKDAVKTILETMDTQKSSEKIIELESNDIKFDLLIPYYKDKNEELKTDNISKFNISKNAYDKLGKYLLSFSDNLLLLKTNISQENLKFLKSTLLDVNHQLLFKFNPNFDYTDMEILLSKIILHLSIKDKVVAGIKNLDNEIIHFHYIKIDKEKFDYYNKAITDFLNVSTTSSNQNIQELAEKFTKKMITYDEFLKSVEQLNPTTDIEVNDLRLIKLSQHYYLPIILSKYQKLNYIKHIIDVQSEYDFIDNLTKYIKNKKDSFEYEWMFSKIDQTIDDRGISMPYFSSNDNNYHDFYPDFIFWLKKDKNYKIVFVDPKGTEYSAYISKLDAFKRLFLENDKPKVFNYKGYEITFDFKLYYDGNGVIPEEYENYWLTNDNFDWLQ